MMRHRPACFVLFTLGCSLSCSGEGDSNSDDSSSSTTNTNTTTSSATNSATTNTSSSNTMATSASVSTSSGGTSNTATNSTTATSTGAGGTGQGGQGGGTGMAAGGTSSSTSTGGGGSGGTAAMVQPSPGCGNGNASPSLNLPANTIVHMPSGYDGSTPVPVVMAFHAAGNPNTQLQDRYEADLGDKYLILYPKSQGNEWNNNADGSKVDSMFSELTSNACIDESRVFAIGHSSGAQFIVQRLCAGEMRWRAIAPVASSKYCDSWTAVPALVMHGIGDQERSWDANGEEDIVPYRSSNGCQQSSTPYPADGCQSGNTQVDPGCVKFDGCSEETIWCQHNDPQYGTSHHGIPCFAETLTREFFDSF